MSERFYSFEIYSLPNCSQCRVTKKWLEARGASFVEKSAQDYADLLQESGIMQAPGVAFLVDGRAVLLWSGFRPGLMSELLSSSACALRGQS